MTVTPETGLITKPSYLCFIDECGSHDMSSIQPEFPVFTLVAMLVSEKYYRDTLVPRMKKLKIKYFGDSEVIFHSRDIRRLDKRFSIFRHDQPLKEEFYKELNHSISNARIRYYAVVIDKLQLLQRSLFPLNPYDVSLHQLISLMLGAPGMLGTKRPFVSKIMAESRGKQEDRDLQNEYVRIRDYGTSNYGTKLQNRQSATIQKLFPDKIQFLKKAQNSIGLQLADLAAYPISRAVMNGSWDNPSAQVIATKLNKRLIVF
jgi:hypothetical protein